MAQMVKNLPAMQETPAMQGFDLWVRMIPWRREWLPTPVFWPGMNRGGQQATVHRVTKSQT